MAPPPPHLRPLPLNGRLGSLCSGLFSASALGVSCSAPNLRDYVRTHHLHHRKPPLSPGSLPCQTGVFGMFRLFCVLLQEAPFLPQKLLFPLDDVLHSGMFVGLFSSVRAEFLNVVLTDFNFPMMVMKTRYGQGSALISCLCLGSVSSCMLVCSWYQNLLYGFTCFQVSVFQRWNKKVLFGASALISIAECPKTCLEPASKPLT